MTASYRDQDICSLRVLGRQNRDLHLYLLRFFSLSCLGLLFFSGVPEAQARCSGCGNQADAHICPRNVSLAEQPLNPAGRSGPERGR